MEIPTNDELLSELRVLALVLFNHRNDEALSIIKALKAWGIDFVHRTNPAVPAEIIERHVAEVTRLTEHLHRLQQHPDFEYQTVKTALPSGGSYSALLHSYQRGDDGWQRNFFVAGNGVAGPCSKRFEFYEEYYFMRKRP